MSAELIIAGGAALGPSAAWFADKIFGPSASTMGDQLKAYLQTRLPTIFGVAEEKARQIGLNPKPIQPGLLARMIADASFSAENEEITDWWANLFVDAAQFGSNEHAVFSDIMALLGPAEVKLLDRLLKPYGYVLDDIDDQGRSVLSTSPEITLDQHISHLLGSLPVEDHQRLSVVSSVSSLTLTWPTWTFFWSIPFFRSDRSIEAPVVGASIATENGLILDVLERAGLLSRQRVTITNNGHVAWVSTIRVTYLGLEFYRACTGRRRTRESRNNDSTLI